MKNQMNARVHQNIGKVVDVLYSLDIALSKGFTGRKSHAIDRGTRAVRKSIKKALDALHSDNWLEAWSNGQK